MEIPQHFHVNSLPIEVILPFISECLLVEFILFKFLLIYSIPVEFLLNFIFEYRPIDSIISQIILHYLVESLQYFLFVQHHAEFLLVEIVVFEVTHFPIYYLLSYVPHFLFMVSPYFTVKFLPVDIVPNYSSKHFSMKFVLFKINLYFPVEFITFGFLIVEFLLTEVVPQHSRAKFLKRSISKYLLVEIAPYFSFEALYFFILLIQYFLDV